MPPSPGKFKVMASKIRHIWQNETWDGKVQILGKNWIEGFKRRNPGVKATWVRARDRKRVKGANPMLYSPSMAALEALYISIDGIKVIRKLQKGKIQSLQGGMAMP
jgi:hypothetical protein